MNRICNDCCSFENLIRTIEAKLARIRNTKARYSHNELILEALNILLEKEKNKLDQTILKRNLHLLKHHD